MTHRPEDLSVPFVASRLTDETVVLADRLASLKDKGSDPLLAQVIQLLQETGESAYLVGGAVRDRLRTEKATLSYDLDFAVPGDGLRLARRIADALDAAFYPLDPERGVGRVVLVPKGEAGEDVSPKGPLRRVIDVARFQGTDLMADLAGRDFSVNAMAIDVTGPVPVLIDPHGGQADLQARRLRVVSDEAIFNDPVRGLRAVRLQAQLGFEVEVRTQTLIRAAAPGLTRTSAERIRDEFAKILSLPAVADSLRRLDELNLLFEILPEVVALKGLAQAGPHRRDAYEHTLQTVAALETLLPLNGTPLYPAVPFPDQVAGHLAEIVTDGYSRRLLLTLAAVLHDVGKRSTATVDPDGRVRFIGHESVGADMAADIVHRLRLGGEAVRWVEAIVRHHLRPLQLAWQGMLSKRAIHHFFRDVGDVGIDVTLLSLADHRATAGPDADDDQWPVLLDTARSLLDAYFNQRQVVVAPSPLLTGHDLIAQFELAQGPEIGRLLAALREAQAVGQVTSREQAEEWVRGKIRDRD